MEDEILAAARSGDAAAQLALGLRLLDSDVDSSVEAGKWISLAADQEYLPAIAKLAILTEHGIGVSQDPDAAADLHLRAGSAGDPDSQWAAGVTLLDKAETDDDYSRAARLLLFAVINRGGDDAELVRTMYLHRASVSGRLPEGLIDWLYIGPGSASDIECLYRAGMMFLKGDGVEQDVDCARQFLQRSAVNGHALANLALGRMLLDPEFNEVDPKTALEFFNKSARLGSIEGMVVAGRMYFDGDYLPKNLSAARRWFSAAADEGDPEGFWYLGRLLLEREDFAEAIGAFRSALDNGLAGLARDRCVLALSRLLFYHSGEALEGPALLEDEIRTGNHATYDKQLYDSLIVTLDNMWVEQAKRLATTRETLAIEYLDKKCAAFSTSNISFLLSLEYLGVLYHRDDEIIRAVECWERVIKAPILGRHGSLEWKIYQECIDRSRSYHDANCLSAALAMPRTVSTGPDSRMPHLSSGASTRSLDSRCFVATACYGTSHHPDLDVLRNWRDERLTSSRAGPALIQFYYLISPFLVRLLARTPGMRAMIRRRMLEPLVSTLRCQSLRGQRR